MLPNCPEAFQMQKYIYTGMPRGYPARQCPSNFVYLGAFAVANITSNFFTNR